MHAQTVHCDIGFCLVEPLAGFAFEPPRTVFATRERPLGTRAVQNCPAVNALERQLVEMPCPVTLRLRLEEEGGEPALSVVEQGTFVEPEKLAAMLSLEPRSRWRHPNRPVLQLRLPYFFVTDTPCILNQLPPFLASGPRRWPGIAIGGRFDLTAWPRTLFWAFEWDRPDQELALRQGEALAYFLFEFNHPDARPRLVEAAVTPELAEYREGMRDLHHMTPAVEEVMRLARDRRPARLLVPLAEAEGAAGG